MSKIKSIILALYLVGGSSCANLTLDEKGTTSQVTSSMEFEKQKGRMQPVHGNINNFIGCRQPESIIDTRCCFSQNTKTYFDSDNIIAKGVADGEVVKSLESRVKCISYHSSWDLCYCLS